MLRIGRARALIGAAISLVALWLVLAPSTSRPPPSSSGPPTGAGSPSSSPSSPSTSLARALRWQRLLAPIAAVPYLHMLQYLLVGYVFNNVLPARLGELVRSHYAGDREGISRSTTLGTVVVERVIDLVVGRVDRVRRDPRPVRPGRRRERGARRGRAWPGSLRRSWPSGSPRTACPARSGSPPPRTATRRSRSWSANLRDGLRVAGRPRTLAEALPLSAFSWSCAILAFAAAGQAIGVRADDRPGGAAGVRRRAGLGGPGRAGEPRHVRAGSRPARQGGRHPGRRRVRDGPDRPRDDRAGHLGRRHHLGRPARLAATGRGPLAEPGRAAGAVSPRPPSGRLRIESGRRRGVDPELPDGDVGDGGHRRPAGPRGARTRAAAAGTARTSAASPAMRRTVRYSSVYVSYISSSRLTALTWSGLPAAARASARRLPQAERHARAVGRARPLQVVDEARRRGRLLVGPLVVLVEPGLVGAVGAGPTGTRPGTTRRPSARRPHRPS